MNRYLNHPYRRLTKPLSYAFLAAIAMGFVLGLLGIPPFSDTAVFSILAVALFAGLATHFILVIWGGIHRLIHQGRPKDSI